MLLSLTLWLPAGADLRMFAPELALVGTIVAVLIVPLVVGRSGRTAAFLSLVGALVTFLLTWRAVAGHTGDGGYPGLSPDSNSPMLVADNFSVFFKLFLSAFLVMVIVLWLLRPGWNTLSARIQTQFKWLGRVSSISVFYKPSLGSLLASHS